MRYKIGSIMLVSGAICIQAGCAYLPGRQSFAGVGLPSPKATIAAAETAVAGADARATSREIARGQTYERGGNYDKARKVYEDVRRREPDNLEAAHRLGIVADIQKRHGEAEQLFLFALSREPDNAELLSDLGYCLFLQGKLGPAADVLSRATELAPTHLRARNNLGLVLGHMGEYDAALAQFAHAGNEADAYFNLAFVYAAQEKTDEAKNCFRRCLQIDSNHQSAREALVSFDEYERLSPAMRDSFPETDGGVRYVPYQEVANIGTEINGTVQQASAETNIPSSRDAAKSAQSLHQRARGMLNRNMSSNRPSALPGRDGTMARLSPAE